MKSKLQLFFSAVSILYTVQCVGQENLGSIKKRYFFVDAKYTKKLILSNSTTGGLQLEVINMLVDHNKVKDYGSNTNLSYAISMIVLPKAGFSHYAFNDRFWREVNYDHIRDSVITFNDVVKLVDQSFKSIREEKDQDSDFEKSNGLSMKTRTYNLIPIIEIDSAFYIPNEAETMTQCFAIDNTTVPKTVRNSTMATCIRKPIQVSMPIQ
ncbi:hypothetical protein [Fibrella aestuarina]|uniref:hypothetical protein n=1 Tax=Fibrella aestuarina TaxID=651143 RepID=UPI00059DD07F|nr:hypothetical protein [Fibrella aestuarina]